MLVKIYKYTASEPPGTETHEASSAFIQLSASGHSPNGSTSKWIPKDCSGLLGGANRVESTGAEAFMGEGIKEGMTKKRRCLRNLQSGPLQSMAEYKAVRVQGKILRGWAEPDGY